MTTRIDAIQPGDADGTGTLLGLLDRQVDVYRRLESLAQRQRTLVVEADPRPLLELLADRQRLTDELTGLSDRLEPFRARWAAVRQALSRDERQNVDRLVAEAGERLGRIMLADQADAKLLAARKSRAASSVACLHSGQRALVAYGRANASGARVDRMDQA